MSFPPDSKAQGTLPIAQAHYPLNANPGPQMYTVVPAYNPNVLYQPVHQRPSLVRRVLRGMVFIFILFVLWNLVFPIRLSLFRGEGEFDLHGEWHYDIPSDLVVDSCVPGNEWDVEPDSDGRFYHTAHTSFELPLTADNLLLVSRGWLSAGLVHVITSPTQPKDTVSFEISAEYHRDHVRDLAKACLVSRRTGNAQGVGLFTPVWHNRRRPHRREDTMHFVTTVVFPEPSAGEAPISINGFETDVPNTSHNLNYLKSKLNFKVIALKGSNAAIFVDSLLATTGSLTTSNALIRGSFETTNALELTTSNGPIKVDVDLLSDGTSATFAAHTSNGNVDARMRLTSSTGNGGKFAVATTTSNSPLLVAFQDAPLDSSLIVDAKTSNSPARVTLHPTYEGAFDIETSSWFKADLNFLPGDDPSGQHRKRGTSYQQSKSHLFGTTSWHFPGPQKPLGAVNVRTTNSGVTLDLLGV